MLPKLLIVESRRKSLKRWLRGRVRKFVAESSLVEQPFR